MNCSESIYCAFIAWHAEIWSSVVGDEKMPLSFVKTSKEGDFPASCGNIPRTGLPGIHASNLNLEQLWPVSQRGGCQMHPSPAGSPEAPDFAKGTGLGCPHGTKLYLNWTRRSDCASMSPLLKELSRYKPRIGTQSRNQSLALIFHDFSVTLCHCVTILICK